MLTTVEGTYKDGKIELAETPVGLEQAKVLVTFLPTATTARQPQVLYGAWADRMPADSDIDSALNAIRSDWIQEWENGDHE